MSFTCKGKKLRSKYIWLSVAQGSEVPALWLAIEHYDKYPHKTSAVKYMVSILKTTQFNRTIVESVPKNILSNTQLSFVCDMLILTFLTLLTCLAKLIIYQKTPIIFRW